MKYLKIFVKAFFVSIVPFIFLTIIFIFNSFVLTVFFTGCMISYIFALFWTHSVYDDDKLFK